MKVTDMDVVNAIIRLTDDLGYPPSVRELTNELELSSCGSVQSRLTRMRSDGLVTFHDRRPRTLRVLGVEHLSATQSEECYKVREVLRRNPDLPIMLVTPDCCDWYDTHYHRPRGAYVEDLLMGSDVLRLYGDSFGLDVERYYYDQDDVAEAIEGWLYDGNHGSDLCSTHEWVEAYRPIANMMARDMPWRRYIVIEGE